MTDTTSQLTPHEIDLIWRGHRHAPTSGTWEQLQGDLEAAMCDCRQRIMRRDVTIGGVRHQTAWSATL